MKRFCIYSSEVYIRQRKTEMKTFVGKSSESSQRSFASYLIFAAGEVKVRTASGPMIVSPRTITTQGSFTNFDSTPLGDRLYAAQCSNLGYASATPLLEGRVQPLAVDFLMEVAC